LALPDCKSVYRTDSSIADAPVDPIEPIPQALGELVAVNVEYKVLLCLGYGCRKAVSPAGVVEHLHRFYKTTPKIRKHVQEYIQSFPVQYNYTTVPLPTDGLALQPIIPIVDRYKYRHCPDEKFKTQSRDTIKKYRNKAHSLKHVADDELFQVVRLQSWFRDSKERYWVVDKSKQDDRDRQIRRATIQDVGEESDESGAYNSNSPDNDNDSDSSQDEIDDQIIQDIER
jgi:hypothetical protein